MYRYMTGIQHVQVYDRYLYMKGIQQVQVYDRCVITHCSPHVAYLDTQILLNTGVLIVFFFNRLKHKSSSKYKLL